MENKHRANSLNGLDKFFKPKTVEQKDLEEVDNPFIEKNTIGRTPPRVEKRPREEEVTPEDKDGKELRKETKMEEKIWSKLEEILIELKEGKKEVENLKREMSKENEKLRLEYKKENEALKEEIRKYQGELQKESKVREEIQRETDIRIIRLEQGLKETQEKMEEQENRSRRQNLIIKGIEEDENEKWEETQKKVQKLFEEKFGVKNAEIARAHRLGKRRDKEARPIIVKMEKERDKENLIKERGKLRGTKIYIDEDYAPETRDIRRKLLQIAKERREQGLRASVSFKTLIVDGQRYRWNKEVEGIEKENNSRVRKN